MENGAKPTQEPMDVPSMMQQMMERMCGAGEFSPADMCRRMMASKEPTTKVRAQSAAPGDCTSFEEPGRSAHDEWARDDCCGPRSGCAPKRR
ncbi:hypothetical protein [Anaeromyxobacter terrae]|uniref:hypothetical protein n=1 Tax=Anaeromyxobacter terrae TaxID=2925406 RepID=UPI001F5AF104|nr:hypothetical protein [Anaeromyxobacter sp. SG22]